MTEDTKARLKFLGSTVLFFAVMYQLRSEGAFERKKTYTPPYYPPRFDGLRRRRSRR